MGRFLTASIFLGLIGYSTFVDDALANDDIATLLKELKSKNAGVRVAAAREVGRLGAVRAAGPSRCP
jgi:hypothetical protein